MHSSDGMITFPHERVYQYVSVVFDIADGYARAVREMVNMRKEKATNGDLVFPSLKEIQFGKINLETRAIHQWLKGYVELEQDYVSAEDFTFFYESIRRHRTNIELMSASIQYDSAQSENLRNIESQIYDNYAVIFGGLASPTMKTYREREKENV